MSDQPTALVYIKNQAIALLHENQFEEAASLLENACLANSADREVWEMLAYIYSQLDHTELLIKACSKLVMLMPTAANHHFNLAFALQGAGQLPESAKAYQKTLDLDPKDAQAQYNLALILHEMGETDAAETHYKKALSIKPNWPEATNNLTQILNEKGDFSLSESLLKNAISRAPSSINLYYRLGETYNHICKFNESILTYQKALQLDSKNIDSYIRIADVLLRADKATDAIKYYQSAQKLDPDNIDAALGLISIYEFQGDYKTARQNLDLLLENERSNIQVALKYARLCKGKRQCNEASQLINTILQANTLPPQFKTKAHFALGKLYDSAKNYDDAFSHFQQANTLKKHTFNAPRFSKLLDTIMTTFSRDQLKKGIEAANIINHSKPVFIIGMPRSGTSLVEQILAGHSQVFGAGELDILPGMIINISTILGCDKPYPYTVTSLTQGMLNKLANHYLEQVAQIAKGDPTIITDKMPENFLHLGLIQLLFPDARIVHCTRNPVDTCLSCYFQEFSGTHSYAYNMEDLGTYYALYQKLMAHWNNTLSLPMITINYETMIEQTAKTCHQLFDFLGLKWEEECLSFYKLDRPVATASRMQVKQPIYSHSINRRDNYKAHLQPLIEALSKI